MNSEILKRLQKFAKEYKDKLGIYGIRLRIEIDTGFNWPDERYQILVNDELFSNDMTEEETQLDIQGLAQTFEIFKSLPGQCYAKILKDRETARIINYLGEIESKKYEYFVPEIHDEDDEFNYCPCIEVRIDELQVTDTQVHDFYVHSVELDDNGNVRLVGRIADDSHTPEDEVFTYLQSVEVIDLEKITFPDYE